MNKLHLFSVLWQCSSGVATIRKPAFSLLASLFVMLLCMHPAKNQAQYYYTFYEQGNYTNYAYQNIHLVSNWVKYPDQYSVSVVPFKTSQLIRLTNHSGFFTGFSLGTTITNLENIPDGMIIKDIETVDDYAVFCGSIMTENGLRGCIGYFDINDFTSGLGVSLHWFVINIVTSVNELVVNYETGNVHVIAIGEWYENNSKTYYVFENTDLTSSTVSALFNEKHLASYETAFEIKSTNNYVAIIGKERINNALYIRRCSWSSGINDLFFNNIHYLVAPTGDNISLTHSTATKDDNIAVSYLSGENNNYSIRVRLIDLAAISNTYSQELPLDTKVEPKDLIYMPSPDKLLMLVDMEYPIPGDYNSLFIDINPYANITYSADVSYFHHRAFYTLDCIGIAGRTFMALGDRDRYAIRYDAAPWPASDSGCPEKDSIDFITIDNVNFNKVLSPISNGVKLYLCSNQSYNTAPGSTSIICYNY